MLITNAIPWNRFKCTMPWRKGLYRVIWHRELVGQGVAEVSRLPAPLVPWPWLLCSGPAELMAGHAPLAEAITCCAAGTNPGGAL